MKKLDIFTKRLKRIGINISYVGNYPWIYINTINNIRVTEQFQGNHGFTVAFSPIRPEEDVEFTNISEIFKLIRLYNDSRPSKK